MEINDLKFTKYLSSEKKNLDFFKKFFSINPEIFQILQDYDKISYTDDVTRFFFLYQNRESLIQKFEKLFLKKELHIHSVVRFLFVSDDFSLKFNILFEYDLNDENDVAIYLNLYYLIEIFIISERIVLINDFYYFYSCYSKEERPEFLQSPYFINNPDFLKISPFLFDDRKMQSLIIEDLESYKVGTVNISDVQVLRSNLNLKLNAIVEEVYVRTKVPYTKLLNPFYLRDNISAPIEKEFSNASTFKDLYGKENDWKKFKIDSNFIYGTDLIKIHIDLQAPIIFDETKGFGYSWVDLEEFYPSNLVGKKNEEIETQLKISEIKNKQDQFSYSTNLRKSLKVNIEIRNAFKLFDGLVDKVFFNKKELRNEFRSLFIFLEDNSIINFPTTKSLETKDIKYIMRFFSKYKGNEFDYNVSDLQYLLTHFAEKPEESNNLSIEKAHRDKKFDLDEISQRELNSIVR
jgi:hypothetical protein